MYSWLCSSWFLFHSNTIFFVVFCLLDWLILYQITELATCIIHQSHCASAFTLIHNRLGFFILGDVFYTWSQKKRAPLNPAAYGLLLELQTWDNAPIAMTSVPNEEAVQSFHTCLAFYSTYTWIALAFLSLQ